MKLKLYFKTITMRLTMLAALLMCCFNAHAEQPYHDEIFTSGDFKFRLKFYYRSSIEDKVYDPESGTVLGPADGVIPSGELVLPEEVAFAGQTFKIQHVGDSAFFNQTGIESIKFNDNYYSIGNTAFKGCTALKSLTLPESIKFMGKSAFEGCSSLHEVNLLPAPGIDPDSNTFLSIPQEAFLDCPVTTLNVGQNVIIITTDNPASAFPNLESCTFLHGASCIPPYILTGNNKIQEYVIPEYISAIQNLAFANCTNLKKVTFPKDLLQIDVQAFSNCPLESLTLPGSLRIVREGAFTGMPTLTDLTIEASQYTLDLTDVFDYNSNIKRVEISRNLKINYQCPWPNITDIIFNEGVTELSDNILRGCSNITELNLPQSLQKIDCVVLPNLEELRIPGNVTEIADNSIGLSSLKTLIFEKGDLPIKIGYQRTIPAKGLFAHCKSLYNLYIHRNIEYDHYKGLEGTSYDEQLYAPFRNMNHLMSAYVSPNVTELDPGMFNDDKYTGGSCLTRVVLPEGLNVNGTPYDKIIYPRDAVIEDGPVIFSNNLDTLYYVDFNYDGVLNLPENLRAVNASAAHAADKLKINALPSGLETVGRAAFSACHSLGITEWECPETLTSVGEEAFMGSGIEKLTVNKGLKEIGSRAFGSPSEIIYNAVDARFIPYQGNNDLTIFHGFDTLTVTEGVEALPDWFAAYSAGRISLPSTLKRIGSYAFYYNALSSLDLPASVEYIGEHAFERCGNLKEIRLPAAITEINASTFAKCFSVTHINIPSGVTKMAYDAFDGCTAVTHINIEPGMNPLVTTAKSVMPLCPSKNLRKVSLGRDFIFSSGQPQIIWKDYAPLSFVIGDKVTTLSANTTVKPRKAFWNVGASPKNYKNNIGTLVNYVRTAGVAANNNEEVCKWLGSMFDDNGITYILTSAREAAAIDCSYSPDVSSIVLPETIVDSRGVELPVASVMPYTFYGNPYITDVTLKQSGAINRNVFTDCTSLKSITAEKRITDIGTGVFKGCSALENISLEEGVEAIGDFAFEDCSSIASFDLPGVVTLGNYVFRNCSALTSFSFPHTLVSIGSGIFAGCSSLTDVIYNENITTIPLQTFKDCTSLKEIRLPSVITSFDATAFTGCTGAESIIIEAHEGGSLTLPSPGAGATLFSDIPFKSLTLNTDVTLPTRNPFGGKSSLSTVILGDEVTRITANMFYNCLNLKDVTFGKNIQEVGDNAFASCPALETLDFGPATVKLGSRVASKTGLTSVRIGKSTTEIGAYAFDGAPLDSVYCYAPVPPVCGQNAFNGVDTFKCILFVPEASFKAYQTSPQWEDFFDIRGVKDDIVSGIYNPSTSGISTDDIRIIVIDNSLTLANCQGQDISLFTLDGKTKYSAQSANGDITISLIKGIYILRIGDRTVKLFI